MLKGENQSVGGWGVLGGTEVSPVEGREGFAEKVAVQTIPEEGGSATALGTSGGRSEQLP